MLDDALTCKNSDLTLEDAVQDFLLHQQVCGNRPRTLEVYSYSIEKFTKWTEDKEIVYLSDINANTIRKFLLDLQTQAGGHGEMVKSGTVWTHFKNLKVFFNFHVDEENILKSPMARVKGPKQNQNVLPAFTKDELKLLGSATNGKDFISIRNRALIYFLLDSGCRLTETANILVQDVDIKTGSVFVRAGKGGKQRTTWVGPKTRRVLLKYSRFIRKEGDELFWWGSAGPLTHKGIRSILLKLGKSCNVHCHAHKFRRTTAITMLRNGCDIYSIRRLLGHADLQVLQRYLDQTDDDVKTAHLKFGPVDSIR